MRTPEDSSPSKSLHTETEMGKGTEVILECRSEWNHGNNLRIGELILWTDGKDDVASVLTAKIRDICV